MLAKPVYPRDSCSVARLQNIVDALLNTPTAYITQVTADPAANPTVHLEADMQPYATVYISALYTQMAFDAFVFASTYWLPATRRRQTAKFEILHKPAYQLCNVLRDSHSASDGKMIDEETAGR